jgi:site-specific DNA recombinase
MKPNAKKRAVIYTRISRVGGRSGDGFISQEIQLEACQDKIEADGLNFLEHIHEEDMSGGNAQRPGYLRAIEMIETGKADVIVIYNIWRFSRTVSDGAKDIDRVTKAGGDLLSCANDIGDNTASGRFQRNVFLALGQMYREQATENFAVAQEKAIERGLYTASKIPFGYRRDPETRKLVAQPEEAATVKKLFEMRTDQESWTKLARFYIDNGGSPKTDRQAVKWIIQNVAYLGHSKNGEFIHKNAHEGIVSQRLFDAANAVKGKKPNRNGKLSSQCLLGGLVYCGTCGHKLGIGNTRSKANYTCHQVSCAAHASAQAHELDAEVIARLKVLWSAYQFAAVEYLPGTEAEVEADLTEARNALADAEYLLEKFTAGKREYLKALEPAEYAAELRDLKAGVEEARISVEMAETNQADPALRESVAEMWETWTDESRREYLARTLKQVVVKSANKQRIPVTERMAVEMNDGLWLHPKAHWTTEPFAEPQSPFRLLSRLKAKERINSDERALASTP